MSLASIAGRGCFLFGCLVFAGGTSNAIEPASIAKALAKDIIGPRLTLEETQAYTESRVPLVPRVETAAEWQALAERLRADVLDRVVYRGAAAAWRDLPTRVEWLDTIDSGAGYRIKKLRYEAVPGMWIPALLYEPTSLPGPAPVFMNVNGHEAEGKAVLNKQLRCINMAKRGMIVLSPEWLGMGQLRGDDFAHYRMNQLDLCGTSGLAPFYLAMKRGLDVLLAHERADATRVGVAGLSGGGWQTIIIGSLDARVTLANPVAGYSSFRTRARNFSDLGDSEQTPCDLATVADYAHLTCLMAPRATLLTFCAQDNCCFRSDHALAPLLDAGLPVFRLFGNPWRLRSHVNFDPGTHNFDQDNREALYRMLGDHFFGHDPAFERAEIPSEGEVKSYDELSVELPPGNAGFHTLALQLASSLPEQPPLPTDRQAAVDWQNEQRTTLADVVKAKTYNLRAEQADQTTTEGVAIAWWRLHLNEAWTVPAVELTPADPQGTTIIVGDAGRAELAAAAGDLLARGQRVLALDPFYFGESKIAEKDMLFALMVATVGDRPLGLQASQVAAAARWLADVRQAGPVALQAHGPRSSLFGLTAAALEPVAIGSTRLHGALGSLQEVIETNGSVDKTPELFCFGLLEQFDVLHLAALAAPNPVEFVEPSDRAKSELAELAAWYRTLGVEPSEK